jgi:hypothetical protein
MEFGLFCNNRRPERTLGDAWEEDMPTGSAFMKLG